MVRSYRSQTDGVRQMKVDSILTSLIKRTCTVFSMHDFSLYTSERSTRRQKEGNFFVPFVLPLPRLRGSASLHSKAGPVAHSWATWQPKPWPPFSLRSHPSYADFQVTSCSAAHAGNCGPALLFREPIYSSHKVLEGLLS